MIKALFRVFTPIQPVVPMQVRTLIPKYKLIRKKKILITSKEQVKEYLVPKSPLIPVILLEDVEDLGDAGDVVDVRANYARRELLKTKRAVYGIHENLIKHGIDPESLLEFREAQRKRKTQDRLKVYLSQQRVVLKVPDMSGSPEECKGTWIITRHDIARYLYEHRQLVVPYHCIKLLDSEDNVIRKIGTYTAEVNVAKEVNPPFEIIVSEDGAEGVSNVKQLVPKRIPKRLVVVRNRKKKKRFKRRKKRV